MTWIFQQSTGEMSHNDSSWVGYSGTGDGRNNPEMESVHNVGPIPTGQYSIEDAHDDIGHLGPCVMELTPLPTNQMFGRSGFFIHGDDAVHDASHGCIILGPVIRNLIATSNDKVLVVTS